MTFEEAYDSYMTVSGRERSSAYQDRLMFKFFQQNFGRNIPIIDVTPRLISRCIAVLRGRLRTLKGIRVPLTPATINRHIQFLQRVHNHTQDLNEPVTPIRWRAFILVEGEQRMSPLSKVDEEYVLTHVDNSILPLFQFSVLTGVRLRNALGLRWTMINWGKGEITFRGKSRRPGGKTYIVPITTSVRKLLKSQEGNNETFVFTYKARRNDKHGHKRGQRYPLSVSIVRRHWEALGLGKRWHDVRHTFGTRLYEVSKDIHLVQRGLNHSNISTTLRYVHADDSDLRAAMERLDGGGPGDRPDLSFTYINEYSAKEQDPDTIERNKNVVKFPIKQRGAAGEIRTPKDRSASTSRTCFKDWDEEKPR